MSSPSPADLAAGIESAWARYLTRDHRPQQAHPYVYASGYRRCERRLVYEMTQPEVLPPFPPEVLAKFRRGTDRERDLLADLTRIGRDAEPPFAVVGQQQRFELRDHQGRVAIVGKVDARLDVNGAQAPLEVKSWSANLVDRIETFDDLFENQWTLPGAFQLLSYLYGSGVSFGFLLLDRSGLPRLLPVELEPHLDRLEDFLMRAERALDHVEAGTLPAYLDNPAECRRCHWYGAVCQPPLSASCATVLTDPDLEALLDRYTAIQAVGKEFVALDRVVKARLRGVEAGIAGPFFIEGKWGAYTRVELPDDVKKQYSVKDPKGKFTLSVTRLTDKVSDDDQAA